MSTFVGADVSALRELATDFGLRSERVDEIALTVDALLSTTTWQGPDRDTFEGMWVLALRPALLASGEALTAASATLSYNADQQDSASAAGETAGSPAHAPHGGGCLGKGGIPTGVMPAGLLPMDAMESGNTPAVPPDVDNQTLQSVIEEIYSGTTNPKAIGDGKLGTALLNEIATGKPTFGQWHAVDSADQLSRLIKLLRRIESPMAECL